MRRAALRVQRERTLRCLEHLRGNGELVVDDLPGMSADYFFPRLTSSLSRLFSSFSLSRSSCMVFSWA